MEGVSFAVNEAMELYDLEEDIGETKNIAGEHPAIVEQLVNIAKKAHTDDPVWPIQNCISSLSEVDTGDLQNGHEGH